MKLFTLSGCESWCLFAAILGKNRKMQDFDLKGSSVDLTSGILKVSDPQNSVWVSHRQKKKKFSKNSFFRDIDLQKTNSSKNFSHKNLIIRYQFHMS